MTSQAWHFLSLVKDTGGYQLLRSFPSVFNRCFHSYSHPLPKCKLAISTHTNWKMFKMKLKYNTQICKHVCAYVYIYTHCTLVGQEACFSVACSSEILHLLHTKTQKFKYLKYLAKGTTSAGSCSSPRLLVKHLLKCFCLSAVIKTNYRLFSWSKKMYTTWMLFYAVYICPEWKIRISIHAIKAMKHPISEKLPLV